MTGGGELRAVILRLEQAAFPPVTKDASQGQEQNTDSPEDLLPGPFPAYVFFSLVEVQGYNSCSFQSESWQLDQ